MKYGLSLDKFSSIDQTWKSLVQLKIQITTLKDAFSKLRIYVRYLENTFQR